MPAARSWSFKWFEQENGPDMIHTPPGAWPEPGPEYLASARFIDSGTESVRRFTVPA